MLERDALRIDPWEPGWVPKEARSPETAAWIRTIADAHTGLVLGQAAWPWCNEGIWNRWWGRRVLEITETEDASLVVRLFRGWLQPWDVLDAEDRWIGTLYRRTAVDGLGRRIETTGRGATVRLLDDAGRELACWESAEPGGTGRLLFRAGPRFDPFRRMVLLAAVLVLGPSPPRRAQAGSSTERPSP